MRKSIKESDYILQFDEFLSLMKKEDITVKVAKNGYVFFADDETLGNNLLGYINPKTSSQILHIQVPVHTVANLDEFENTKELVDFIISEYSHYKRKFESKKSARKSIKESLNFKNDYAVEVMGGTYWLKPFYWDFDEFRDDLLIASEESGFTYYITEATTTDYRINLEFNDGFDMGYDITFRIIPKSDKATAKELNDYLN